MKIIPMNPQMIDVTYTTQYDNQDHPTVETSIFPGSELLDMQQKINLLFAEYEQEKHLRETHTTVKDAWEQYQIVLGLVK